MSTQALAVQTPQELTQWKSPTQIKQRMEAIGQLLKDVLQESTKESGWDGDYGKIPGTGNKPSLLKSGSEKILAMFEIGVEPFIEDLSTEDCRRYRITARMIHTPTQTFLGAGIGEASTDETKYKWKRTYSKAEWDNTAADRRRIKYSSFKGQNGMDEEKQEWQIRTEPADLANTVLKMAKKRAQIDGTLTVTGASSMFSQDLEEDDIRRKVTEERKGAAKKGKPTQDRVICSECRAEGGHLPSCKFNPKNQQQGQVSTTGQPVQAKPAETQAQPVQTTATAQQKPLEKKAENAKPTKKGRVTVAEVKPMKSKKGTDYLLLSCKDEQGNAGDLYVWHKHLFMEFGVVETDKGNELDPSMSSVGKVCILEMSSNVVKDQTYFSVEHIHEMNGVKYLDDKPVASPAASDVGFTSEPDELFEEEEDDGFDN